jgi:hypothetical protein
MNKKYNGLSCNESFFEVLNNCYTYAINQPVNPFNGLEYSDYDYCQPGKLGGRPSCRGTVGYDFQHMIELYVKPDLEEIGYDIVESTYEEYIDISGAWKIAYACSGRDYHFYRQHEDGTWSQKYGKWEVTDKDESGKIITNPETCDRGDYADFRGYFMIIPKSQENIEKEVA